MTRFVLFFALALVQNAYSQSIGVANGCNNGFIPTGFIPNVGIAQNTGCGCAQNAFAQNGLGFPANGLGVATNGYGVAANGFASNGCGSPVGYGDVAVTGELPVGGCTSVAGQVPVIGYVTFEGTIPAGGLVSVANNNCGCGGVY